MKKTISKSGLCKMALGILGMNAGLEEVQKWAATSEHKDLAPDLLYSDLVNAKSAIRKVASATEEGEEAPVKSRKKRLTLPESVEALKMFVESLPNGKKGLKDFAAKAKEWVELEKNIGEENLPLLMKLI